MFYRCIYNTAVNFKFSFLLRTDIILKTFSYNFGNPKMEPFKINTEISAGKKEFEVLFENHAYTLVESGSIAAVIKCKDNKWLFTKGSYSEEDAEIIGNLISQNRAQ